MIIRYADPVKDALEITEGAMDFASHVEFKNMLPASFDEMVGVIGTLVSCDKVKIFLADHSGIVGGLGVLVSPYVWNPKTLVMEELFWWVKQGSPFRTAVRLFDRALEDAKVLGAVPIFKALSNSPSGVTKMYLRHGLSPVETTFRGVA
jgi:hypothetical protein